MKPGNSLILQKKVIHIGQNSMWAILKKEKDRNDAKNEKEKRKTKERMKGIRREKKRDERGN